MLRKDGIGRGGTMRRTPLLRWKKHQPVGVQKHGPVGSDPEGSLREGGPRAPSPFDSDEIN